MASPAAANDGGQWLPLAPMDLARQEVGAARIGPTVYVVGGLLDTIPFYAGVHWLSRYLEIDPTLEHAADEEELVLDEPRSAPPQGPSIR